MNGMSIGISPFMCGEFRKEETISQGGAYRHPGIRMFSSTLFVQSGKSQRRRAGRNRVTGRYRLEPQRNAAQGGIVFCIIIEPGPGSQINIPGF